MSSIWRSTSKHLHENRVHFPGDYLVHQSVFSCTNIAAITSNENDLFYLPVVEKTLKGEVWYITGSLSSGQ